MIVVRATMVSALLMGAAVAAAQQPAPQPAERRTDVMIVRAPAQGGTPAVLPALPPPGADFDFVTMPLALPGETVTGAPYSAEAVTEMVQTLADGNRIVRESKAAVYRDAAGRTRREQGLSVIGSAVNGASGPRQVQIHDPQAGATYMLDLDKREAHRLPSPKIAMFSPGQAAASTSVGWTATFEQAVPPPPAGASGAVMTDSIFIRRGIAGAPDGGAVESLGTRVIEGVEAEGTRSTLTIPAGQIGNEQPINIVSERWFSPALKVLVLSRQTDPRFGETTYRLTNITRAEPAPDLFIVPSDFKVVDAPGMRTFRFEKK
jgi:hypothetical protein